MMQEFIPRVCFETAHWKTTNDWENLERLKFEVSRLLEYLNLNPANFLYKQLLAHSYNKKETMAIIKFSGRQNKIWKKWIRKHDCRKLFLIDDLPRSNIKISVEDSFYNIANKTYTIVPQFHSASYVILEIFKIFQIPVF